MLDSDRRSHGPLIVRYFAGTTLRPLRSSSSVQMRAYLTSKADEYRAKARECQKHAEQTRDPFIKQQLLENIHLIRLNSKFATNGPWGELMGALDL
jgi:hypothetical protein